MKRLLICLAVALTAAPAWALQAENPHGVTDELVVAFTLALEARGEGVEGLKAVGQVIATRARERRLTPAQVCLQPKQFSCWNATPSRRSLFRVYEQCRDAGVWDEVLRVARQVQANSAPVCEMLEFANHYHSINVKPRWARSGVLLAQVGNHLFYQLP